MIQTKILAHVITSILVLSSASSFADSSSKKIDGPLAVCRVVVDAANRKKLDALVIPLDNKAKVDINGDGKQEQVELNSDGTMHWEALGVSDLQGNPIEITKSDEDDWEGDRLRWALNQQLIKYEGHVYILGKTDDYLHYLSQVDKYNVEKVICEFSQRSEPIETIVESNNDKLCQLGIKRELDYVEFDRPHALTYSAVMEAGFAETSPGDYAAQVDIDNDGIAELIVKLKLASGRGRGCDGEYLGVLNRVRNRLNKEISGLLPEPECGGIRHNPFSFEGRNYIEVTYPLEHPSNTHRIVYLARGNLDTVCQYDVRVVNYVLGI